MLNTHVAWDLGVTGLAQFLSARLDAFLILHNYSRLVIDANRPPDAPDSIVSHSEHTPIAANGDLTPAQRRQRLEELFQPYHHRIGVELDARAAAGPAQRAGGPAQFHAGAWRERRPWHVGVLHGRDGRLARRMLRGLERERGLRVGDNEPYAVSDATDYTVVVHGEQRGIPHVELEVRQDLLATEAGQQEWAERLARVLERSLAEGLPPLPNGPPSLE